MIIIFTFIPGLMLGIEFPHDDDIYLVIDFFVIRLLLLKRTPDESLGSV